MRIKGNSGCDVTLLDESTIRKSGHGPFAARLKRQIEKQTRFHLTTAFEQIRTPAILRTVHAPGVLHADMEFISAKDFVQFITEADRAALDGFLAVIEDFIAINLSACQEIDVTAQLAAKLAELAERDVPPAFISAARARCEGPILVPCGPCHGDLTLSNILFKGSRLYLIDFLDSFVESPLQDVVKLRQDTFFGWSLKLYDSDFDATKVRIGLRYLDRRLHAAFTRHAWYRQHYELFQIVNLMRILPYCKDPSTTAFVTHLLDCLFADKQAVSSTSEC
jgi:phosphotransferase family enzyme